MTRSDRFASMVLAAATVAASAAIGLYLNRRTQKRTMAIVATALSAQQGVDAISERYIAEARDRLHKKRLAAESDARMQDLIRSLVEGLQRAGLTTTESRGRPCA